MTELNYCPKCGVELFDGANFCHKCGEEIDSKKEDSEGEGNDLTREDYRRILEEELEKARKEK